MGSRSPAFGRRPPGCAGSEAVGAVSCANTGARATPGASGPGSHGGGGGRSGCFRHCGGCGRVSALRRGFRKRRRGGGTDAPGAGPRAASPPPLSAPPARCTRAPITLAAVVTRVTDQAGRSDFPPRKVPRKYIYPRAPTKRPRSAPADLANPGGNCAHVAQLKMRPHFKLPSEYTPAYGRCVNMRHDTAQLRGAAPVCHRSEPAQPSPDPPQTGACDTHWQNCWGWWRAAAQYPSRWLPMLLMN